MRLTVPSFCRGALLLAGLTTAVSLPAAVRAADPQPYEVTLKPTGNSALDGALHDSSRLISLRESAPVGGFALVERARQDVGRFETALHSYGYYKAQVTVTIDGHPLTDPTLPATIEQAPAKPPMPVEASFDLGPQFHLGKITIQGAVPPDARAAIGLKQGDPAMAADVLAARDKLLHALQENSYPLAKVDLPPATLRLNRNELDVTLKVDTGPQADIGPITITGLKDTNESFVRKRLLVHPGEKFSPSAIEKARADLASIGVFSVVRVQEPDHLDPNGTLPLTFDVTERPLHAVDLGIAYSTDLGVNFSAGWHDRNLFGNAEQLNLTAAMQLGGNALTKPGYQFGAQFIKPDFLARDQSLEIDLNAVKQSLQAYDQRALMEKIAINRRLSQHWTGTIGIAAVQEDITQQGVTRRYNLIGLPVGVRYDSTNSIFDPTQGARAAITVTPTAAVGVNSANFVIMQASGSTYFDFGTQGRSVLALRGMVGKVSGANVFDLPPDQRFYAGGSATVRGYRYQSLGPQFPDHDPTGGTAMSAGTIEFRQRIIGNFGAVAFVDAGQVTSNGAPFTSNWRVGTGVGARYYTPIGPIRLDVAVPLNKEPGGDSFELYIGIGQAF
jgi:translocation and assembly module TamA